MKIQQLQYNNENLKYNENLFLIFDGKTLQNVQLYFGLFTFPLFILETK